MSFVDPPSRSSRCFPILLQSDMDANPLLQFRRWFDAAVAEKVPLPQAMTLATSALDGQPSARTVFLRDFDERGFVFFTNYDSRKGSELAANPRAALVFFWELQDRQVLVEGRVEMSAAAESDAYFASRPRGSQLGAWASPQSQMIESREILEQCVSDVERQYAGLEKVPRPPFWGGFRVVPTIIEFWQGQPSRLHDRIRYRYQDDGSWLMERLAP